jgi:MFS family permease
VLFATLFTLDSVARAIIAPVIPLEALNLLGSARNVSVAVAVAGIAGVCMSLVLPSIIHRWRPRASYLLAIGMLGVASLLMISQTVSGFGIGWMMRSMAAAGLLGLLNIYIAGFIDKRDLAKSEPLRTFFSATAWVGGPYFCGHLYGISPLLPFVISIVASVILFIYFRALNLQAPSPVVSRSAFTPLRNIKRFFIQKRLTLAWVLNFGREMWWVTLFTFAPIYLVQAGKSQM